MVNLISWGFGWEADNIGWPVELMHFVIIGSLIVVTGRRNAAGVGREGYSYGRAVSFVFALMLFAGIVFGIGRFLMVNYIAHDYYAAINEKAIETMVQMYRSSPMAGQMRAMAEGMMTNPLSLMFMSVCELVIKGGFLGLFLCAFLYKKPDMFAGSNRDQGAAI